MPRLIPILVLVALWVGACGASPHRTHHADPVRRGHSHNDYNRKRPLQQALELGYGSIEADIWLVDGVLLVGHDREDLKPERTLVAMYLDPLAARARERGAIYGKDDPPLQLLIDIKSNGEPAYAALHELLYERSDVFSECNEGRVTERAVKVVISGACPRETIAAQTRRWAFVDGRKRDLEGDAGAPTSLVPLVSEAWTTYFSWPGIGEMPEAQRAKLRELVTRAHARGYTLRFWGAPQVEGIWREQYGAGVDWINADDLQKGAEFLRGR
jgi:glycerophosphoryl diester phosphodiesterase